MARGPIALTPPLPLLISTCNATHLFTPIYLMMAKLVFVIMRPGRVWQLFICRGTDACCKSSVCHLFCWLRFPRRASPWTGLQTPPRSWAIVGVVCASACPVLAGTRTLHSRMFLLVHTCIIVALAMPMTAAVCVWEYSLLHSAMLTYCILIDLCVLMLGRA